MLITLFIYTVPLKAEFTKCSDLESVWYDLGINKLFNLKCGLLLMTARYDEKIINSITSSSAKRPIHLSAAKVQQRLSAY